MKYSNGTSPIIKERTAIHFLKAAVEGFKISPTQTIDYTKSYALSLALGIDKEEAEDLIRQVAETGRPYEEVIAEINAPVRKLNEEFRNHIKTKVAELRGE